MRIVDRALNNSISTAHTKGKTRSRVPFNAATLAALRSTKGNGSTPNRGNSFSYQAYSFLLKKTLNMMPVFDKIQAS
jgi:hypothetical protein